MQSFTHFSLMLHFYTKGFLTFSEGIEIEHWAKIVNKESPKILNPPNQCEAGNLDFPSGYLLENNNSFQELTIPHLRQRRVSFKICLAIFQHDTRNGQYIFQFLSTSGD